MQIIQVTVMATVFSLAALASAETPTGPTQAQLNSAADSSEWLLPNHDYASQRFVGLKEVTPANASKLRPVCVYQAADTNRFLTNPLMYADTLYVTTGTSTIALDASTCKPRWRHDWKAKGMEIAPTSRGAAIKDGKVIRGTNDGYLIALDAATGKLLWERQISAPEKSEQISIQPLVYENLVILGFGGGEFGLKGWLGAFRLEDGAPVWRFNTIPDAGAPGAETWSDPEALMHGGGAVWTSPALDTVTGEIFVPVGNPAPLLSGTNRKGTNLYTSAMLVLDAKTGALKWFKQFVPHDTHDWDLSIVGPLVTDQSSGSRRPMVTVAGKDGLLRVLNRDSHEELYSTAIARRSNFEVEPDLKGVHTCPGASGGALWSAPAYSPTESTTFVASVDWCGTFKTVEEVRFTPGQFYFGGAYEPDPVDKARGWVTAIETHSGAVRWKYESPRPVLAAVTASAGGVLFTGELTGDFLTLDAKSGKVLYRFYTGGPVAAGVISYGVKGKQYVAVASGAVSGYWQAPGGSATILVFALP